MKVNNYKIETIKCLKCGYTTNNRQSFNSHIAHAHNMKSKEYYDTYIKKDSEGLCKTCGKPTNFKTMWVGYRDFCCDSCMSSNKDIQEKRKQTSLLHYGVDYISQSEEVRQKVINTCQERYNADNVFASEYGKNKIRDTLINKYNVTNIIYDYNTRCKMAKSRVKNGNHSSLEDYLENILISKNINFKKDYIDEIRYPFKCDFYLVDSDTFIEINNYWVHNDHFYDKNNIEDQLIVEQWKNKNKTHYDRAIKIWTIYDVNKHDMAIKNNLNYIVLWNKKDIDNYILTL